MTPERHPIASKGAWLDLRRRDVTASEIGALFGLHPYRTALQVYLSKTGQEASRGDTPAMRRGRWMEPAIAEAFREEHPEYADALRKAADYWRLPGLRLGATPDYFIGEPGPGCGLLECKSMSPEAFAEWGEAPPLAYTLQVAAQMMCTGAAWGVIAVLVMNRSLELFTYPVPRVAAAEKKIAEGVAAFWERTERGEAPPPVMPQDGEALAQMFPRDDGSSLDLEGDNELPVLLAERASLKVATKRLAEIDAAIKAKLGPASTAFCSGWRISFRSSERREYVVPAQTIRTLRIARLAGGTDGE